MSDEEPGRSDLAALIEADVKVSGGRTPAEVREAFVASAISLLHVPEPEIRIVRSEDHAMAVTVRVAAPRWPGSA